MSLVEFKKVIYQNLRNFTQEEVFEAATNGARLAWTRAEAAEYLSQMLNYLSRAKKDDNLVHNYQLKLVSLLAWYQANPNNYTQLADKLISRILEVLGIQGIQEKTKEETKEETKENCLTELKNRISKFEQQQLDIDRAAEMAKAIRKTTTEIETILHGYLFRLRKAQAKNKQKSLEYLKKQEILLGVSTLIEYFTMHPRKLSYVIYRQIDEILNFIE